MAKARIEIQTVYEVEIPEGYYRVFRGAIKPGDKNLDVFEMFKGRTVWLDTPPTANTSMERRNTNV